MQADLSKVELGNGKAHKHIRATLTRATEGVIDECVPWGFTTDPQQDYAITSITLPDGSRSTTTASRLVLSIWDPRDNTEGLQAAHHPGICERRDCINPYHLRWADVDLNQVDIGLGVLTRLGVIDQAESDRMRMAAYDSLDKPDHVPNLQLNVGRSRGAKPPTPTVAGAKALYQEWQQFKRYDRGNNARRQLVKIVVAGHKEPWTLATLATAIGANGTQLQGAVAYEKRLGYLSMDGTRWLVNPDETPSLFDSEVAG